MSCRWARTYLLMGHSEPIYIIRFICIYLFLDTLWMPISDVSNMYPYQIQIQVSDYGLEYSTCICIGYISSYLIHYVLEQHCPTRSCIPPRCLSFLTLAH
jgi:hypothetical protein